MSTIYLTQQGGTVTKKQGRFLIQPTDQTLFEVIIREVSRILVFGNVHLTTPVIATCLQAEIPVLFLSQFGRYKGHLWSASNDDLRAALAQFERWKDQVFQLTMAQAIVRGKLRNSKQLLLRFNRKRNLATISEAIEGINADIRAVAMVETVDQLRGHEGAAAARYFPALGQLVTVEDFKFQQRTRRPPKDPPNALLSFGYTLLYNNVLSLILAEGLNPYLGNLHRSDRKETHLAFDLMEEFRSPVVDSLVMTLINRQVIKGDDFLPENGGIYLTDIARKLFIEQFEARMVSETSHPSVQNPVSYRRAIQLQIQQYKHCVINDTLYEAFLRAV